MPHVKASSKLNFPENDEKPAASFGFRKLPRCVVSVARELTGFVDNPIWIAANNIETPRRLHLLARVSV
jgi:hypothetical protein